VKITTLRRPTSETAGTKSRPPSMREGHLCFSATRVTVLLTMLHEKALLHRTKAIEFHRDADSMTDHLALLIIDQAFLGVFGVFAGHRDRIAKALDPGDFTHLPIDDAGRIKELSAAGVPPRRQLSQPPVGSCETCTATSRHCPSVFAKMNIKRANNVLSGPSLGFLVSAV